MQPVCDGLLGGSVLFAARRLRAELDVYKRQELAQQMPVLKELLADLGFVMVAKEGYEADDILGTLSAAAAKRGDECFIATGDRDSLQLVSEQVTVLLAATRMGRSETVRMDTEAIAEKYGVAPVSYTHLI